MKGENSVERAKRMLGDLSMEINVLRGCELDAQHQVEELTAQLEKATNDLEEIREQKLDALYTSLALRQFIESGGGLDMLTLVD